MVLIYEAAISYRPISSIENNQFFCLFGFIIRPLNRLGSQKKDRRKQLAY